MPTVTLSIMIQDGSNQHELAHAWDFYDLAAKPEAGVLMLDSMVKLFNKLAQQVDDSVQLELLMQVPESLQIAEYKRVVRDQSAQIARQQGEIIRLEAKIKLMRATEYCRVHRVTHVDDRTLKNWVPGPVLPAPAQMNLDEMVAASEGMLSMDSSNQIYSGLREDAELTELVALMSANIHRHYNPEL